MNWFPGHMRKSLNELAQKKKIVDVIIEVRDARLPFSSANPELTKDKKRIIILNKADLADQNKLANATEQLDALVMEKNSNASAIFKKIKQINKHQVRVLIVGIPNVGKSTIINKMKKSGGVKVENRPGVTRGFTFIHLPGVDLLDSPGILPMKFANEEIGYQLYLISTIKSEIGDPEIIGAYLLEFLKENYQELVKQRYKCAQLTIEAIALSRNIVGSGGQIDYNKAYNMIINEFKQGLIGRVSFE